MLAVALQLRPVEPLGPLPDQLRTVPTVDVRPLHPGMFGTVERSMPNPFRGNQVGLLLDLHVLLFVALKGKLYQRTKQP